MNASDWRPMDEAPQDGTVFLAWLKRPHVETKLDWSFCAWSDEGKKPSWYDPSTGDCGNWFVPTHWMPLPEHPERRRPDGDRRSGAPR